LKWNYKEGFGFPCSIETAVANCKGRRSQNQYINDKHLLIQKAVLNKDIREPQFIIEQLKLANVGIYL